MIIYEVNLRVDREIREAYLQWLATHVQQMLALPGFLDAECYEVESDEPERFQVCVWYRLSGRQALEAYFTEHAEAMRDDGEQRFGGRFSAHRRILEPLQGIPRAG